MAKPSQPKARTKFQLPVSSARILNFHQACELVLSGIPKTGDNFFENIVAFILPKLKCALARAY
jgi:hypothetical protein